MSRRPVYRSSIAARAKERVKRRHPDGTKARVEYTIGRSVVGYRDWDKEGLLEQDWALKNGRDHGLKYWWVSGRLVSVEPYSNGVPHGTAKQWTNDGRLLGTYVMKNGTGIDLWRQEREDGSRYLSEVYYLRSGRLHGFVWWINENQKTVYIEHHHFRGQVHGIWREWDSCGRLERGYPQYFVASQQVTKREYVKACAADPTLPPFREEDNKPARTFPREIARHLRFPR